MPDSVAVTRFSSTRGEAFSEQRPPNPPDVQHTRTPCLISDCPISSCNSKNSLLESIDKNNVTCANQVY